jgi:hypothetical protein
MGMHRRTFTTHDPADREIVKPSGEKKTSFFCLALPLNSMVPPLPGKLRVPQETGRVFGECRACFLECQLVL